MIDALALLSCFIALVICFAILVQRACPHRRSDHYSRTCADCGKSHEEIRFGMAIKTRLNMPIVWHAEIQTDGPDIGLPKPPTQAIASHREKPIVGIGRRGYA